MNDQSVSDDQAINDDQSADNAPPIHAPPWPRWLRFGQACAYVGIRPPTMTLKLAAGKGPAWRFVPGTRIKIFHVNELDRWITETPPLPMSNAERGRLVKLQAGGKRGREKMRARRQAEIRDASFGSRSAHTETEPAN